MNDELERWLATQLPPTKLRFEAIAKAYIEYEDRPLFLQTVNKLDYGKLVETLVLFNDLLMREGDPSLAIRWAHQHYIINTPGQIPDLETELASGEEDFDVFEWATQYARMYSIDLMRERDDEGVTWTYMTIDDRENEIKCEEWGRLENKGCAESLREVGQLINQCRYGRFDVISSRLFPFKREAFGYNKNNAMWLSEMSNLAYRQRWYVEKQLSDWGFATAWVENAETDTQAFVAAGGDFLVVCFRGTRGAQDMLTDLNLFKKDFRAGSRSRGKVHGGFLNAFESVWKDILHEVDRLGPFRPIFVTGHSLGAALAQLAAYRLAIEGKMVTGVYVFGSPRVGNNDFVNVYNAQLKNLTHLHINGEDIVTQIPSSWLGYRHAGAPPWRFVSRDGVSHIMEKAEEDEAHEEREMNVEERVNLDLAQQSIYESNQYLDIRDLTRYVQGNTYAGSFDSGRLQNHSISDYLFKFACSILEDEFGEFGIG